MSKYVVAIVLMLFASGLLLGCSGSNAPASTGPAQPPAPTAVSHPTAAPQSNAGQPVAGGSTQSLDFTGIDVCKIVSVADFEAVYGPLSKTKDPQVDPPNDPEKGCTIYNDEGNFVDIVLHPTSDWDLLKQLQADAKDKAPLDGNTAFSSNKLDAYELFVLRSGKAVVEIRVSTGDLDQARKFAQKVLAKIG